MTATDVARQIQTSANKAIVSMRANRDAIAGLVGRSLSSGIKRARCWSLNCPLFSAQKNTIRLMINPSAMYAM